MFRNFVCVKIFGRINQHKIPSLEISDETHRESLEMNTVLTTVEPTTANTGGTKNKPQRQQIKSTQQQTTTTTTTTETIAGAAAGTTTTAGTSLIAVTLTAGTTTLTTTLTTGIAKTMTAEGVRFQLRKSESRRSNQSSTNNFLKTSYVHHPKA